jgi:DNA topoisomerase VI subunit A
VAELTSCTRAVRPSDLDRYNVPKDCRLDLTPHDIAFAESLKEKPYIQKRKKWVDELEKMLACKEKAEIRELPPLAPRCPPAPTGLARRTVPCGR